jgi:hypothetical protein
MTQTAAAPAQGAVEEPVRVEPKTFKHRDSGATIRGIQLASGTELQKGDKHDSPTGRWVLEDHLSGHKIAENCNSVWVRPVSEGL